MTSVVNYVIMTSWESDVMVFRETTRRNIMGCMEDGTMRRNIMGMSEEGIMSNK